MTLLPTATGFSGVTMIMDWSVTAVVSTSTKVFPDVMMAFPAAADERLDVSIISFDV